MVVLIRSNGNLEISSCERGILVNCNFPLLCKNSLVTTLGRPSIVVLATQAVPQSKPFFFFTQPPTQSLSLTPPAHDWAIFCTPHEWDNRSAQPFGKHRVVPSHLPPICSDSLRTSTHPSSAICIVVGRRSTVARPSAGSFARLVAARHVSFFGHSFTRRRR